MIWQSLPRPFLMLAPLEGVADTVFRQIVASVAKPDVFVTEFTSADGFCSPGRTAVRENFLFTPMEKPIIAQIWGRNPDTIYETVKAISGMGFSGIDINMGCPDRNVCAHGGGAAMINTPEIAAAVIRAAKEAIKESGESAGGRMSMSVKTRIGVKRMVTESWITFLLEQGIDALTVHGRTAAELSKVPAHWDEIAKAVEIRNKMNVATVIIGNGDVKDAHEAMEKYRQYGVDGVMIGRGIFSNMWAFDRSEPSHVATATELLDIMERHIKLFSETWKDRKHYAILKKFYKIYVNGFFGATEWRVRCMDTNSAEEILTILQELKATVNL